MRSNTTAKLAAALLAGIVFSAQIASAQTRFPQADEGEDGRWSTGGLFGVFSELISLANRVDFPGSTGRTCIDDWNTCQEMDRRLSEAYDHAFYVFHHNTDFNNQCLYKYLDDIHMHAGEINYWIGWLNERSYRSGLADMAAEISYYVNWPLCSGSQQGGGTTAGGGNTGGSAGALFGTRGTGAGTGITINESKLAMNGARACQNADLQYGRHWIFQNPANSQSRGDYYEHDGYLCRDNGKGFYVMGTPYKFFSCNSGWSGCERKSSSDATVTTTTELAIWGDKKYNKGKIEWVEGGYADWDVYQGWW